MKAVVVHKHGGIEELKVDEIPDPEPGEGEILIEVHAASINPIDWKIRKGIPRLLSAFPLPQALGCDVSGVVSSIGSDVTRFSPGDEVYALVYPKMGGNAERIVCSEKIVARKPPSLSHIEAAAIPASGLTALQGLGDLQSGQRVLINGAGGGVGTYAVQIAKAAGCHVTAVCSDANRDLVTELGADQVIDYGSHDFTQLSEKFDLVFDAVGLSSPAKCGRILEKRGLYVSTLPSPSGFFSKLLGSIWRGPKAVTMQVEADAEGLDHLSELVAAGKLKPIVNAIFPLDQIGQAHELSETGHVRGKIVLSLRE